MWLSFGHGLVASPLVSPFTPQARVLFVHGFFFFFKSLFLPEGKVVLSRTELLTNADRLVSPATAN